MKTICEICHHSCSLNEGQTGICRGRRNLEGRVVPINYGLITGMALDPIEKKPLRRFYPGSMILSVGSFGCNLKCGFCQNHEISMSAKDGAVYDYIGPDKLVQTALDYVSEGNIGIAYTYNEPLVGYEYVRDCAISARKSGLKNVLVTNGCFNIEAMEDIFPLMDAMNIDLKGFTDEFYNKIGGDLETVKKFIAHASRYSHVEITTLIVPDENDSEEEVRRISEFIAGINSDIPLHISRFFPRYKMSDRRATEVAAVYRMADTARRKLKYVYEGNC